MGFFSFVLLLCFNSKHKSKKSTFAGGNIFKDVLKILLFINQIKMFGILFLNNFYKGLVSCF
ncbi:MAG TPA: hypothetical protein DEF61_02625 [Firmicutes bacterium]|nr:hypothetical protein [Bacillota bacterium]HBM70406.1 hypothetical protein [Bacillota bacterium]HBX25159.1 hypothetical protein [Bacillota bacterium]